MQTWKGEQLKPKILKLNKIIINNKIKYDYLNKASNNNKKCWG